MAKSPYPQSDAIRKAVQSTDLPYGVHYTKAIGLAERMEYKNGVLKTHADNLVEALKTANDLLKRAGLETGVVMEPGTSWTTHEAREAIERSQKTILAYQAVRP